MKRIPHQRQHNPRSANAPWRCLALATALILGGTVQAEPPTVSVPSITPPSVSLGAKVMMLVIINGTPPLTIQWQLNGEDIAGATEGRLDLEAARLSDAGQYTVVVRNAEGEATSAPATLDVDPTFTKEADGSILHVAAGVAPAWMDYDQDGFLDLFVGNGGGYRPEPDDFHRNNGDGTFTRITEGPLVTDAGSTGFASWGDYDNDGFPDLFVGSVEGTGYLYRNKGDGSFERMGGGTIGIGPANGAGVWGDYDQDGFLDLFVGAGSGYSHLYHNDGDGTFSAVTDNPAVTIRANAWSSSWADYDNDGRLDLFVANRSGPDFLFHNLGGGAFAQIQEGEIVTDSDVSIGAAWGDYDNDGFLDLLVANGGWNALGKNRLYHNNGDGTFTRITEGSLVTDRRPWASGSWADYDNDGDLDLFVSASQANGALYRNNGDGTLTEVTTGSLSYDGGSSGAGAVGVAWGDYDNDGFPDLVVATIGGWNWLYRNNGNANHWITVQCEGRVSNRSAIGTKVRVQATIQGKTYWQMREISNGDAMSGNSLDACFGLGDAGIIDRIRIEWPSGIVQELTNVPVDQFLAVTEPGRIALSYTIRLDDAAFVLTVTTDPEQSVTIYGSEDLMTWTEVAQSTGGGEVLIVPPTTGVRFFKAQAEP
jgi:enediyne biosynthesis protein E4